ncbi:Gfo/Idh/MocA family protein [Halomicrococcus sp. NG-SE-24]|uniref:Gfo/Idh/MocA family protein n=1 Tax=Halomicrococcus sp. NG-SE-24 TaxID=3436928 RepID=UPI003D97AECE
MTVSLGVLSTAHVHADGFAALLDRREDVEFVGVADADADRGREAADRYGVPYMATEELLAAVDGALVFSTNTTHERWVTAAADAGVDVLCEKPLATSRSTARRLVERCKDAGVALGMNMPLPFSEPARAARRAYRNDTIGDLTLATGTNRARFRNRHEDGWSADPERAGGGAVMDHTVHVVDLVRWITGREVTEVHAELATMRDGPEVEDINVLSMELDDGTPFTLDGSWDRPDNWDYWGDATLNLVGTAGELTVDCFDYKLRETRDVGEDPGIDSVYWGELPNEELLADFVETVRTGRSPTITGEDGFREAAVCVAAYESAEAGEPVSVDY